uniref:Ig-like domain-containing protein n=1 Tax=Oncorhynchus mykiss TaxID=8022 RepID=A0A8C7NGZ0_ONCMY
FNFHIPITLLYREDVGKIYELTQPASLTVQPGQPLTISCKVSYSVSSYYTAWIRQPAGKTLEWIGYISSGGGTAYKDSLKNKFSITRDTSSNTLFLKGQSLQTEDTAVYYCNWPYGSELIEHPPVSPSLFVMTPSEEEMHDKTASFACLARDFSPKDHEITWLKNNKPIAKGVTF